MYQIRSSYTDDSGPGPPETEVYTRIDSIAIIGMEVIEGDTWWLLSSPLALVEDRFMVRNNSTFSEYGGLQIIRGDLPGEILDQGSGWSPYGCTPYMPTGTYEVRELREHTVPAGTFSFCYSYFSPPSGSLWGCCAYFEVVPGVGIIFTSSSRSHVMMGDCSGTCTLLRYHIEE